MVLAGCWSIAILAMAVWAQATGPMPRIEGESFAGHKVVLPDAAVGKVVVLVFGFTKASKEPTGAWAEKILSEFGSRPGFDLYQLPVLEDVPRLIRGMVISGIRKGVKENLRDHFVPVVQGEAELKKLVGYNEPNDAYLVILDRSGHVIRQMHGPYTEQEYKQFHEEVRKLLNA